MSPGRIFIRFMRIRPERCASTRWSPASLTRKVAEGRSSSTMPSTSRNPFLLTPRASGFGRSDGCGMLGRKNITPALVRGLRNYPPEYALLNRDGMGNQYAADRDRVVSNRNQIVEPVRAKPRTEPQLRIWCVGDRQTVPGGWMGVNPAPLFAQKWCGVKG